MALQAPAGQRPDSSPGTNSPPDCSCPGSAYRIVLGPRAGQKVLSLRTVAGQDEKPRKVLSADAHGFSLHAAVRCAADGRKQLERLCRYITRPELANERLSRNGKGQVVLRLKSPYRDGTTHIVMRPQEFMSRLAALVPRPRLHLIRFHGVLAPNAKLRSAFVPDVVQPASKPAHEPTNAQAARMSWARLLNACSTSTSSAGRAAVSSRSSLRSKIRS